MMVSVVIPTYNAMGNIEQLFSKLKKQQLNNNSLELLIIDSSSQDGTAEFCASCSDIHFIQITKDEFNHGRTRNIAAIQSHGDILVFMTQDAMPFDTFFLSNLIKPIIEKKASAAFGRQIAKSDASSKEILTRLYNYPSTDSIKSKNDIKKLGIKTFFFTDVCSAIDRKVFFKNGMFPDHTISNEDMLLCYNLIQNGYKVAYTSQAKVLHSHNYSSIQQFQRNFDIAVSLKMHREILQYTHTESEGIKYVKQVYKALIRQREYKETFDFILQLTFKFLGYRLGLLYQYIPLVFKKRFSMNDYFWDK